MIIYLNESGKMTSIPSSVPMGTILNDVTIIAPQYSATLNLLIKPPYQEYIKPIVCEPRIRNGVVVYSAKIPEEVTKWVGRVEYQVMISKAATSHIGLDGNGERGVVEIDEQNQFSALGSFNVNRGIPVEVPEEEEDFEQHTLNQIWELLNNTTSALVQMSQIYAILGVTFDESGEATGDELDTGDDHSVIRAVNKNRAKLNGLDGTVSDHTERIANAEFTIQDHESRITTTEITVEEHKSRITTADGLISSNRNRITTAESRIERDGEHISAAEIDIDKLEQAVGAGDLDTADQTLKGAVNELNSTMYAVASIVQLNRTNLTKLAGQVEGIGRSFVVQTFNEFLSFIRGGYIEVSEDCNGDGTPELYPISASSLVTGDNILIVEHDVADFWFEKNANATDDRYTYDGEDFSLLVSVGVGVIGCMHVLETDYNVIANHATSASVSASEAKAAAEDANEYRSEVRELYDSIYCKQIAPSLDMLSDAIVLTTPSLSML